MENNNVKVVVVEDELIIAQDISDILRQRGYNVVATAKNYHDAITKIELHEPDLVILDIRLKGELDGVDIASHLRKNHRLPFVFISSHADKSTLERAKEVHPYGYLIKPFGEDDVLVAVEMALNNFGFEQEKNNQENNNFVLNNSLFIRQKNFVVKIAFDDIFYIEADANYSTIISTEKKFVIRATLKDLEEKLPGNTFYRSHKSYLINLSKLTAINSDVLLIGEAKLPIGRKQQAWLMEHINRI